MLKQSTPQVNQRTYAQAPRRRVAAAAARAPPAGAAAPAAASEAALRLEHRRLRRAGWAPAVAPIDPEEPAAAAAASTPPVPFQGDDDDDDDAPAAASASGYGAADVTLAWTTSDDADIARAVLRGGGGGGDNEDGGTEQGALSSSSSSDDGVGGGGHYFASRAQMLAALRLRQARAAGSARIPEPQHGAGGLYRYALRVERVGSDGGTTIEPLRRLTRAQRERRDFLASRLPLPKRDGGAAAEDAARSSSAQWSLLPPDGDGDDDGDDGARAVAAMRGGAAAAADRDDGDTAAATAAGPPTYGLRLRTHVYYFTRAAVQRCLWQLGLPPSCLEFVARVADADVVLHVRPRPGQRHFHYDALRAQAAAKSVPFISVPSSTSADDLGRALLPVFALYAAALTPGEVLDALPSGRRRRRQAPNASIKL